jgi:hypothetical protein
MNRAAVAGTTTVVETEVGLVARGRWRRRWWCQGWARGRSMAAWAVLVKFAENEATRGAKCDLGEEGHFFFSMAYES